MKTENLSNEDICYCNLIISDTYKRIFNYESAILYLEKAKEAADKITINQEYYYDNITCKRAFALFDTKKYDEAKILMQNLAKSNYKYINPKAVSMLVMQEAHLLYLDEKYQQAEDKFNLSILKMREYDPCNLPLVYGKKIALYGAMKKEDKMLESYKKALQLADSCRITKYNLYVAQSIANTYKRMGNYEKAYQHYKVYESLKSKYKADDYNYKLKELEVKYESDKKEQQIHLKEQIIIGNKRLIFLLAIALVALVLLISLYITIQRRKKLLGEKNQSALFTKHLLNNIEIERKRVAADLHDSVNNELLLIKSDLSKTTTHEIEVKIDRLMNNVRSISRNLHPVMFEELGLKHCLENLIERVQKNHQFILNAEINYLGYLKIEEELQLYRIIQEAVSNILKYSKAEAAIIKINETKHNLEIEIIDNGTGFNVENVLLKKDSFGLHNIIERSKAIKGTAIISSSKEGTKIYIEIKKQIKIR